MEITIYQKLVTSFPLTWHHRRLMNVSTNVSIIPQQVTLIPIQI
jgi:hypothetical protein